MYNYVFSILKWVAVAALSYYIFGPWIAALIVVTLFTLITEPRRY